MNVNTIAGKHNQSLVNTILQYDWFLSKKKQNLIRKLCR